MNPEPGYGFLAATESDGEEYFCPCDNQWHCKTDNDYKCHHKDCRKVWRKANRRASEWIPVSVTCPPRGYNVWFNHKDLGVLLCKNFAGHTSGWTHWRYLKDGDIPAPPLTPAEIAFAECFGERMGGDYKSGFLAGFNAGRAQ